MTPITTTWHASRERNVLAVLLMLILADKHPHTTMHLLFSYKKQRFGPLFCFLTPTVSHTFHSRATNERSTQYPKRVLSKFTLSSATESRRSQRALTFVWRRVKWQFLGLLPRPRVFVLEPISAATSGARKAVLCSATRESCKFPHAPGSFFEQ